MDDAAYLGVKSIGLSRLGGRKPCTLLDAARHNLREIQAERGANSHIDAMRMGENIILAGACNADGVIKQADSLLASAGVGKLRTDHCQAIELVFSLPDRTEVDAVPYFERCLRWASTALGLPVLSAVVHMDEGARHCHVLTLPLKAGVHIGSKPIGKENLTKLRTSFFDKVAGPSGLARPMAKLYGPMRERVAAAVVARCRELGLPDANGVLWPLFEAMLRREPLTPCNLLGMAPESIIRNTIGIDADGTESYRVSKKGQKDRTLSCVGFAHQEHFTQATEATPPPAATFAELWERVGCKAQVARAKQAERLEVAAAAVAAAVSRQAARETRKTQAVPLVVVRDDGRTVDRRDAEHCPW
jgi:hypothetical protein